MLYVRIVLLADVLHQLPIQQHGTDRELPGLGVGLRIIDGMFDYKISPVYAPEALNDMQRFGGGKTGGIDPKLAVEADRIHYQRIPVPTANRIPQPGGVRILGMRAAIHEDLPPKMRPALVNDDDQPGRLDNAERERSGIRPWHPVRQAQAFRIVLPDIGSALFHQVRSPG